MSEIMHMKSTLYFQLVLTIDGDQQFTSYYFLVTTFQNNSQVIDFLLETRIFEITDRK